MARNGNLSGVAVQRAKGPAVLFDGNGLYLRVTEAGAKRWVFRYQADGRRHDMGLGSFPEISLAEARQKAAEHRRERQRGTDPLAEKAAQRTAERLSAAKCRTFREAAEEFMASHEAAWCNAVHRKQWRSTLETYVYPVLGDLPVAAIDTGLVLQVLSPLWQTKPETASRVRGRIEMVLDAAKVRGWRSGENPAQWKGNLAHLLPARAKVRTVKHHAALPYHELPAFLAELQTREGMAARALEFTILTAVRTGEAIGARWNEIDLAERTWAVPAGRMKARRAHRVPLSEAALAVLDTVRALALMTDGRPDPEAPVFPGPRPALPLSNMALLMALRRMGRSDLTAHGFRSTFSDWTAERTSYPREVVEMALAHTIESKVEAAYRRGDLFDKRRRLMDEWARFCAAPPAGGHVVPLRAAE